MYFFFFNVTGATEIYTYGPPLSLHDALPICRPTPEALYPTQALCRYQAAGSAVSAHCYFRRCPSAMGLTACRNNWPCRASLAGSEKPQRSEEHTSELQSLMRISYAVFCLKKKKNNII